MSELMIAINVIDSRAEQVRMSKDQHFETIAETIEWLDDASFSEIFGSEERLEVHEVASLRVLQAH